MAEASFPDIRARSSPGTAIAMRIPMIPTTVMSSMSVKPSSRRRLFAIATVVPSRGRHAPPAKKRKDHAKQEPEQAQPTAPNVTTALFP